MKAFTISGISFMPQLWKPKKNLDRLLGYVDEAATAGAQVIATPEGILDGYITPDYPRRGISLNGSKLTDRWRKRRCGRDEGRSPRDRCPRR